MPVVMDMPSLICGTPPLLRVAPLPSERDNRLRYFVINDQPASALTLLERSVFQTPTFHSDGKARLLRLPPATVCAKVLDGCARTPALLPRVGDLTEQLLLKGTDLEPRCVVSVVAGLAKHHLVRRDRTGEPG